MAKFVMINMVLAVVLLKCASAQTVHVVGDSMGWVVPTNGGAGAFETWAGAQKFVVGDILTFNFATGNHDVQQVPKASFDACTTSNAIGSLVKTGPANITLDSAGDHYFICTVGQHCQRGQKLAISVSPFPTSPTTPTPPTTPSPNSATPDDCAPTSGPTAHNPTGSNAPSGPNSNPNSSSSSVLAGVLVPVMTVVMGFFF